MRIGVRADWKRKGGGERLKTQTLVTWYEDDCALMVFENPSLIHLYIGHGSGQHLARSQTAHKGFDELYLDTYSFVLCGVYSNLLLYIYKKN